MHTKKVKLLDDKFDKYVKSHEKRARMYSVNEEKASSSNAFSGLNLLYDGEQRRKYGSL